VVKKMQGALVVNIYEFLESGQYIFLGGGGSLSEKL
jgi:hypothetical protein